jgi:undecaprenyl-diphosphatase
MAAPTLATTARPAREVIGCGSYDAAVDWPPMWLPAAGAVLFVLLAFLTGNGVTDGIDATIIDIVRTPAFNDALQPLRWITQLGSTWAMIVVAAIVIVIGVVAGMPREAVRGALGIGLGALLVEGLKAAIARTRPDLLEPIIVERGFSFPSGHAANSMVAYGILAVIVGRLPLSRGARVALQVALAALVFLIGLSRVWLGVHYPTDVVAGWMVGGVLVLAYAAFSRQAPPGPAVAVADADRAVPRSDPPAGP